MNRLMQLVTPELALLSAFAVVGVAAVVLVLNIRRMFMSSKQQQLKLLDLLIQDKSKKVEDLGQKLAQKELLDGQVKKMQDRLELLKSDLPALEAKHTLAAGEYEKTLGKLNEEKLKMKELEEKHKIYQDRIEQIEEMRSRIEKLDLKKKELEDAIQSLPTKTEELKNLNEKIKKTQEEFSILRDEIQQEKQGLEDLKKKREEAEKEIDATTKTLSKLKEDLSEILQEVAKATTKRDAIESSIKNAGRLPEGAFESLYVRYFKKANHRGREEEERALDSLATDTDQAGFQIPKRLQEAFHTALKSSDISCLTVMAGVSGTGKSAFPKIYANAVGMNFLPLAVEPRWDSPQDLFGFLNYVENRFEATSLGRALVQFNNAPVHLRGAQQGELSDQVLMVLLDEMNLARIEYYFSEFLSRLEMRRNVNLANMDENSYKMVTTEIFGGYPEKLDTKDGAPLPAVPSLRLFAGSNVIFVGTMNEDESTQSLSDKVIDRANVIHFGKPDKMKIIGGNTTPSLETLPPIAHETWKSWCQNSQVFGAANGDVLTSLNQLNQLLSMLGRPFGWRTFQAILTYIANHPQVSIYQQGWSTPLSDQIAMRVMPKLRGVDTEEHASVISQLNGLIDNLGDNALSDSFNRATNSGRGWFDWKGLDWSQ